MRSKVLEVLARHLSRAHAELTLRRAASKAQTNSRLTDAQAYPRLAAALESSLTAVLPDAEVREVVGELRSILTPEPPQPVTLLLHSEADISIARQAARSLAQKMGARSFAAQHFTTAVSELARNIVQYAKEGVVELAPVLGERRGLRVVARDEGPGIEQLDEILAGDYRSRTGLGKGIAGVRRLMTVFQIESSSEGTRVEAELHL